MTQFETRYSCATSSRPVLRCSFRRLGGCDRGLAGDRPRLSKQRRKVMYHDFNYEATLASSLRAAVAARRRPARGPGARLHAATSCRRAWPARLRSTALNAVRAADAQPDQPRTNICACSGWSRSSSCRSCSTMPGRALRDDDWRVRALLNFAGEEAKHIHLFKRFHAAFERGFPVEVRDDRPVRGDRRRRCCATIRSRSPSSS